MIARGLAFLMLGFAMAAQAKPMTLEDYMALDGPPPAERFPYGEAPSQFAELFLPAQAGPHPIAIVIHGGCWTVKFGGIRQMRSIAGALIAEGIAVWNVEYRRVDEAGGGYPGMYQDVNDALAKLAEIAPRFAIDTRRIVAIGHSAGGHLVQWIAGRDRIPVSSPVFAAPRLAVREIISLGGLADLRGQKDLIRTSCERDVAELTGPATPKRPDPFSDTSAADLVPNGSRTVLITGALDRISPPETAHDYARIAAAAGDKAEVIILPEASHFDEVSATSPAWSMILPVIKRAVGMKM